MSGRLSICHIYLMRIRDMAQKMAGTLILQRLQNAIHLSAFPSNHVDGNIMENLRRFGYLIPDGDGHELIPRR
jgi:hypothetical protein